MLRIIIFSMILKISNGFQHIHKDSHIVNNTYLSAYGLLFGGVLLAVILHKTSVKLKYYLSYKFLLILVGMSLGFWTIYCTPLKGCYNVLKSMNIDYIFFLIYPLYVLISCYQTDVHLFLKLLPQILVLSIVGWSISAVCFAVTSIVLSSFQYNVFFIMLYSSTLSTVDDTSISDGLFRHDQLRNVLLIIEGEFHLGLIVNTFFRILVVKRLNLIVVYWYEFLFVLIRECLGGMLIGVVVGKFVVPLLLSILVANLINLAICIICLVYAIFSFCEYFALVSGPLAIFIVCMYIARERARIPNEVSETVQQLWVSFNYIVQSLFYVLLAAIMSITAHERGANFFSAFTKHVFTFICGIVIRFVVLILLYPVLKRLSYGLDWKSLLALFWLPKKGIMQMVFFIMAQKSVSNDIQFKDALNTVWFYVIISQLVHGLTATYLLNVLEMTNNTREKRENMTQCIEIMQYTKLHFLNVMKLQRFNANVNWMPVQSILELVDPYQQMNEENDEETGSKTPHCPDCDIDIFIKHNSREIQTMRNETRQKIKKVQKISFVRQHEKGFLSRDGLKALLLMLESDTNELMININEVLKAFRKYSWLENIIYSISALEIHSIQQPPRKRYRKICYKIVMHKTYDLLLYIYCAASSVYLIIILYRASSTASLIFRFVDVGVYYCDFIISLFAYSHIYLKSGIKLYFRNYWKNLDFMILVGNTVALLSELLMFKYETFLIPHFPIYDLVRNCIATAQAMSFCRLLKFISTFYNFRHELELFSSYLTCNRIEVAFDMGMALTRSYNEILHLLPSLVLNENIRKEVEDKLHADKIAINMELRTVQREIPKAACRVKCKQAIFSILTSMRDVIHNYSRIGLMEYFEFDKFILSKERCLRVALRHVTTKIINPKYYLTECPWLKGREDLVEMLYENAVSINYVQDEMIVQQGTILPGVFFILEGFVKMIYKPDLADRKPNTGVLPGRDYISNDDQDYQEDYYIAGNSFGELSMLTNTASECSMYAAKPTRILYIPNTIIFKAMQMYNSPSESLEIKMWTYVTVTLSSMKLWNTPMYRNMSKFDLVKSMRICFVPVLTGRPVFVTSELIEDMVLVQGKAIDIYTDEIYTAPCYIPRRAQKLLINKKNNVPTKIFFVPISEHVVDELLSRYEKLDTDQ